MPICLVIEPWPLYVEMGQLNHLKHVMMGMVILEMGEVTAELLSMDGPAQCQGQYELQLEEME